MPGQSGLPQRCPDCNKVFGNLGGLNSHGRFKHGWNTSERYNNSSSSKQKPKTIDQVLSDKTNKDKKPKRKKSGFDEPKLHEQDQNGPPLKDLPDINQNYPAMQQQDYKMDASQGQGPYYEQCFPSPFEGQKGSMQDDNLNNSGPGQAPCPPFLPQPSFSYPNSHPHMGRSDTFANVKPNMPQMDSRGEPTNNLPPTSTMWQQTRMSQESQQENVFSQSMGHQNPSMNRYPGSPVGRKFMPNPPQDVPRYNMPPNECVPGVEGPKLQSNFPQQGVALGNHFNMQAGHNMMGRSAPVSQGDLFIPEPTPVGMQQNVPYSMQQNVQHASQYEHRNAAPNKQGPPPQCGPYEVQPGPMSYYGQPTMQQGVQEQIPEQGHTITQDHRNWQWQQQQQTTGVLKNEVAGVEQKTEPQQFAEPTQRPDQTPSAVKPCSVKQEEDGPSKHQPSQLPQSDTIPAEPQSASEQFNPASGMVLPQNNSTPTEGPIMHSCLKQEAGDDLQSVAVDEQASKPMESERSILHNDGSTLESAKTDENMMKKTEFKEEQDTTSGKADEADAFSQQELPSVTEPGHKQPGDVFPKEQPPRASLADATKSPRKRKGKTDQSPRKRKKEKHVDKGLEGKCSFKENEGEYEVDEMKLPGEPESEKGDGHQGLPFICAICQRQSPDLQALQNHLLFYHGHQGGKIYPCPDCGKAFRRQDSLRNHRNRMHLHKKYECPICKKLISDPSNLRSHVKYTHSNVKPFICEYCGDAFKSPHFLTQHIRQNHMEGFTVDPDQIPDKRKRRSGTATKQFCSCEHCGRQFKFPAALSRHVRNDHQCQECGETFVLKTDLTMHETDSHPTAKTYECELCGKVVGSLSQLAFHNYTHKCSSGVQCVDCKAFFKPDGELQRHREKYCSRGEDLEAGVLDESTGSSTVSVLDTGVESTEEHGVQSPGEYSRSTLFSDDESKSLTASHSLTPDGSIASPIRCSSPRCQSLKSESVKTLDLQENLVPRHQESETPSTSAEPNLPPKREESTNTREPLKETQQTSFDVLAEFGGPGFEEVYAQTLAMGLQSGLDDETKKADKEGDADKQYHPSPMLEDPQMAPPPPYPGHPQQYDSFQSFQSGYNPSPGAYISSYNDGRSQAVPDQFSTLRSAVPSVAIHNQGLYHGQYGPSSTRNRPFPAPSVPPGSYQTPLISLSAMLPPLYNKESQNEAYSHSRRFECLMCDAAFGERGRLHQHEMMHMQDQTLMCKYCGSRQESMTKLVLHTRTAHGIWHE